MLDVKMNKTYMMLLDNLKDVQMNKTYMMLIDNLNNSYWYIKELKISIF